jgi:hypothetical protein
MFLTPEAFIADFNPELHLQPSEREIYRARAKVCKQRFPWSSDLLPLFNNCLIHLSANVPGKVAYYQNVPNMVANRITRTSPEMFLQRTLTHAPQEIRTAWAVEVLGQTLPTLKFINNDDPDGWYNVYECGPGSCMAGSQYVRQYAVEGSNLALCYIETNDKITHRVIVNQARKTYLRIYSNGLDINYFVAALNKAGYRQDNETLFDEPIALDWRECDDCGRDVLVGPYLDGVCDLVLQTNSMVGRIGSDGESMNYSNGDIYCGCCHDEDHDDEY